MSEGKLPKWLTVNEDDSVDIDFTDKPFNMDGTKVTTLNMREPSVQDQLLAEKGGKTRGEQEIALFANLTEQSPEAIRGMKIRQYGRLQDAYDVFTD